MFKKLLIHFVPFLILFLSFSNEATANDSLEKPGDNKQQNQLLTADRDSARLLGGLKRRLTSKTPKEIFMDVESLYSEAKEQLRKAPVEDSTYQPEGGYALLASMKVYLSTLLAIDGYCLSKGVIPESLPDTIAFDYEKPDYSDNKCGTRMTMKAIVRNEKYGNALTKIHNKGKILASSLDVVFDNLYFDNFNYIVKKWEIKKMNEGFDNARFLIRTLKEEAKKEKGWR